MRLINYIFRFILFTICGLFITLVLYFMTIMGMIFINWDLEYKSLKEIHTEMYDWWKKIIWEK